MWHVTHDMLHMTHDIWHMTHRGWWILCPNFRSKALTFWEQWCFEDFEEKDHWLNEWITKECVLCISGTKNYRFELYIREKLFLFCSWSCCLCFMETIWRMLAKGSLFSFLMVFFPEEDDQVAWKTEHRWGQRELSDHLPCHWCPSWTRPVDGGCGGPGWFWGAGRRGDGPAGSRRSCYTGIGTIKNPSSFVY